MQDIDKKWIIENVFNERGKINPRSSKRVWWEKKDKASLYDLIVDHNSELPADEKYAARLFCFLNDITKHPCCAICGAITKYAPSLKSFPNRCPKHALDKAAITKRNETTIDLYGHVKNFSAKEHQLQAKSSMIELYGTDNPMSLDFVKEKIKKTSLEKYGETSFAKTIYCKELSKATKLQKYGSENLWDLPAYREKFTGSNNKNYNAQYENMDDILLDIERGDLTRTEICVKHNVSFSCLLKKLKEIGKNMDSCKFEPIAKESNAQKEIASITEKYFKTETGNRSILKGLELDVLVPDKEFAIEYCGDYWHSFAPSDAKPYFAGRHQEKALKCIENGIDLFTIFEHEWNDSIKKDIWISKIEVKLGIAKRIFARSCVVSAVNHSDAEDFLQQNHLQGSCPSSVRLGLYFNNNLVSLLTLGKSRFDKNYEYELLRFASLKGTVVVGGFTRLMKRFEIQFDPKSIVSYCNLRWSSGNIYSMGGFRLECITPPNHVYLKGGMVLNRISCQKHKLPKLLGDSFDPDKTGQENMFANGYRILRDCGNMKFSWREK